MKINLKFFKNAIIGTEKFSDISPIRFFIITAFFFGSFFVIVTPPLQGADETTHFFRAYQISEFDLISHKSDDKIGGKLPDSLGKTVDAIDPNLVSFNPAVKYGLGKTKAALHIDTTDKEVFYSFPGSATYAPVSYIGSVPGVFLSRILRLPVILSLYFGRMSNLLLWIFAVALSLSFLKRRKWVVVFIGLLPMALFQAATINGDTVVLGSLMIFLSYLIRLRDKTNISKKDLAFLLVVATVLTLSKQIMFVFLPLVLLLKNSAFRSRAVGYASKIGLIILPLLFYGMWVYLARNISNAGPAVNHENPSLQLSFLFHSPLSFLNVLWNTYFFTWGDGITRSVIGTFGWSDTPLSELITTVAYAGGAFLVFATTKIDKKFIISKVNKILISTTALLYFLAVSASLYLYYSPVGYKIVYGLQGRYFLPILVVLLPFLATDKIKIDSVLYKKIAVYLPLVLLFSSSITIFVRYFVNNV